MNTIKFSIAAILLFSSTLTFAKIKNDNDTVVCFKVSMDCMSCKQKIEKNIAYEKGVKALDVNLSDKTVKVKYNKLKNSPEILKHAIEKLKYEVKIITEI
jgi:copper chaperone CopZ